MQELAVTEPDGIIAGIAADSQFLHSKLYLQGTYLVTRFIL